MVSVGIVAWYAWRPCAYPSAMLSHFLRSIAKLVESLAWIAARAAFKEGIAKAGPQLLEPMMRVEVVTPDEYMGDIIGDLNSRRGQVTGMEPRGNGQVVNAMVPLATMFGYVNTLRSLSQGRAQYTMHFDHYDAVPQMVAEEIRAKYA